MIIMTLYGAVTLLLIIAFIALCIWAYSPKQQQQFLQHAHIPLMDTQQDRQGEGHE